MARNRLKDVRRRVHRILEQGPVGDRVTASTDVTRESARHSSNVPAPTIPVAPNSSTFTGTRAQAV